MSTTTFTMTDVARLLGISRSKAFEELQSWPHERVDGEIVFTAEQVAEVKRLMSAGPEEQAARRQLIEDKRTALREECARDLEELADEPNH